MEMKILIDTLRGVICSEEIKEDKKQIIIELLQANNKDSITWEDSQLLFETCIFLLTNTKSYAAELAVFSFFWWGSRHKQHLKNFISLDLITHLFGNEDIKLTPIVILWLKDSLKILLEIDPNYVTSLTPAVESLLHDSLQDMATTSSYMRQLAELYCVCPSILPPPRARLRFIITLMNCIASFPTPTKPEDIKNMKITGNIFSNLWHTLDLQDFYASLREMYAIISSTDKKEVCPAMAHILSLVPLEIIEQLAPRIVIDLNVNDDSFLSTLQRLTLWLIKWPTAQEVLIIWIRTLIRLLYINGHSSIPAKITLLRVNSLVSSIMIPVVRPGAIAVMSCLLLSFQHSPVAFHKVLPGLAEVIHILESENSDSSRNALQQLILISHALMKLHPCEQGNYHALKMAIEKYPYPTEKELQTLINEHRWCQSRELSKEKSSPSHEILSSLEGPVHHFIYNKRDISLEKAGLRNLGNTCYVNSIIQSLFMTDDFRHDVLKSQQRCSQPLRLKLQHLFGMLCFSHRSCVAPQVFHDRSRPPWFSPGIQQDCSEYLRYLLITLHEEERAGQTLKEFQERVIIESETASIASDAPHLPDDDEDDCLVPRTLCFENSLNPCFDNNFHAGSWADVDSGKDINNKMKQEVPDLCDYGSLGSQTGISVKSNVSSYDTQTCDISCVDNRLHSDSIGKLGKRKNATLDVTLPKSSKSGNMSPDMFDNDCSSDSGISGDITDNVDNVYTCVAGLSSPHSIRGETCNRNDDALSDVYDAKYFTSLVQKIFGGKISTSIKCLNCQTESVHRDVFTDINLAFKDTDHCTASSAAISKQKTANKVDNLKIGDLVLNYLTPEELTGDNQYECGKCHSKQDALRYIKIIEGPEHLILTQLRFYYDLTRHQRQKVFTSVEFDEELCVPINFSAFHPSSLIPKDNDYVESCFSNTISLQSSANESTPLYDNRNSKHYCTDTVEKQNCSENVSEVTTAKEVLSNVEYCVYSLYAVVVHSGFSSEGGHYYCYGRNSSLAGIPVGLRNRSSKSVEWYHFNDETVTEVTFDAVCSITKTFSRDTAYLLFYKKVGTSVCHTSSCNEDFLSLPLELRESIEKDNLQYQSEQEAAQKKKVTGASAISKHRDHDSQEPPSAGGGCGSSEGNFSLPSRFVF